MHISTNKYTAILCGLMISSIGCNNRRAASERARGDSYSSSESSHFEDESKEGGFEDGTWCASVTYYNPNTGTSGTYTLNVEVQDNELIKIYWGNGGWLDEDHFYAQDLDEDGYCSFTSDKGNSYTVTLSQEGGCGSTDEYRLRDEVEEDRADITCPKCGDSKYSVDDYCSSCERKMRDEEEERNNTCSECGAHEYGVRGGKCSSCKDDEDGYR